MGSHCGHQSGKKPLEIRDWTYSACQNHHDRDINASKNTLVEGLRAHVTA
ncbi:zinc ribbon domain-containing protein [Geomicrobium sp. JCM 19055]